jgi:hypothetical protein
VRDWSSNAENLGRASTARSRAQLEDGRFPSADCHDADSLGVEIEAGWATSPGHREAMLDGDFTHVGSGAAWDPEEEDVYVVHVFVRRIPCGFRNGPCCETPLGPAFGACHTPLFCSEGSCR